MSKEKISNPLTIVGIFAGIAEVAGTVVIPFLSENLQATFMWYVMLFPILLVILFFLTWNFNPTVLYSPSDYQHEENFLTILTKGYKSKIENNIDELELVTKKVKDEIVAETIKVVEHKNSSDPVNIEKIINSKMVEIINKINETKDSTTEYTDISTSYLQDRIIRILTEHNGLSINELSNKTNISRATLHMLTTRMIKQKIITFEIINNHKIYKIY